MKKGKIEIIENPCLLCKREIEGHSFKIPLCVECLVRIHCETTCREFDKCAAAHHLLDLHKKEATQ